jgi:hypothetical protein
VGQILSSALAKDYIPDGSSQSEASSVVLPRQAEPPLSPNECVHPVLVYTDLKNLTVT